MWRLLFLRCMILDHKLQRMLNDSKIAQLNSERPLHQTAVCCGLSIFFSVYLDIPVMVHGLLDRLVLVQTWKCSDQTFSLPLMATSLLWSFHYFEFFFSIYLDIPVMVHGLLDRLVLVRTWKCSDQLKISFFSLSPTEN